MAGAVEQIRSLEAASTRTASPARPASPAPSATAPRTARLAGKDMGSWLPDGMDAVSIERSARLVGHGATLVADAGVPSGLHDTRIGRSTRLALAEPAPPQALIRDLEASRPQVAVATPAAPLPSAVPPVQTASLESDAIVPSVPSATPQPKPASPAVGDAAPVVPADAPPQPRPEQALEVPLPTMRPIVTARLEAAPADKVPEPRPAPVVAAVAPATDGLDLPDSAPLPAFRPQRAVRSMPARGPQPSSSRYELAYASPETTKSESDDSGGFLSHIFGSGRSRLPGAGSGVAVYSIKDATVYLPNGDKLEAHSGMGRMTDNPRYADEKMRGPTPPNVYNLTMREHLFHGVEAVRMLPADGRNKFGRDGFLAHTYMLRGAARRVERLRRLQELREVPEGLQGGQDREDGRRARSLAPSDPGRLALERFIDCLNRKGFGEQWIL